MVIRQAEFVVSARNKAQFPNKPFPEIAFAGRSNVGKSSLINQLLGRKQLARVGNQPGKTRQVNFFVINEAFHFVDLPGYGFAQVSQQERAQWQVLIESYLRESRNLRLVIQVVDSRHPDTQNDVLLSQYLFSLAVPSLIVMAKTDKLNRSEVDESAALIREVYKKEVVPVSSETGEGMDSVWERIEEYLKSEGRRKILSSDRGIDKELKAERLRGGIQRPKTVGPKMQGQERLNRRTVNKHRSRHGKNRRRRLRGWTK